MHRFVGSVLLLAACQASGKPPADASSDLSIPRDTALQTDTQATVLRIDFSIEGCPSLAAGDNACKGFAPMTLRFIPIASVGINSFQWDFGDGSAIEPEETPAHIYAIPGTFTVRVVGSDATGNTVSHEAKGIIVVSSNPTGASCQYSYQCASPLGCLCPTNATCSKGPSQGMCTNDCQAGDCNETAVCADLAPSPPPVEGREAWQGKFCLAACTDDQDCPIPLRCRFLPGPGANDPWVRGCFTNFPVEMGASCMDEKGRLRDDLCAGGVCIPFGYKGLCAKECVSGACPADSSCATFGNGYTICLRQCSSSFRCDQDPALACEAPGPGSLGFRFKADAPVNSTFCAPKRCSGDDTCGDLGRCLEPTNNGHCSIR